MPEILNLHDTDETAWLEQMADLIRAGRYDEIDPQVLAEYLTDMAKRDRREVYSRLIVLIVHLLKCEHQPEGQCSSWRGTIREQRRELTQLFESGTLRSHAFNVLAAAYSEARLQAADETGLDITTFPEVNLWDLDSIIMGDAV